MFPLNLYHIKNEDILIFLLKETRINWTKLQLILYNQKLCKVDISDEHSSL